MLVVGSENVNLLLYGAGGVSKFFLTLLQEVLPGLLEEFVYPYGGVNEDGCGGELDYGRTAGHVDGVPLNCPVACVDGGGDGD